MNKKSTIISILIGTIIGILIAFAGAQNGQTINGYSIFAICVAFAYVFNWLVFLLAYQLQTEKFYDLMGSLTYISVTVSALFFSKNLDTRSILLSALVLIWTIRLGAFLFQRIHKIGKDDRFDEIKTSFLRFLNVWTLQAIWVTLTASAALIAITSASRVEIGVFAIVGLIVWLIGFVFEVVADYQKSQFKKDSNNKNKFIKSGLWARSRHPNYFGEIVLWIGVMIIAIPVLEGWQWVGLISPVFVTLLLMKVSGVPMLEKKADKKWGGQADYESYKSNTPILIPKL